VANVASLNLRAGEKNSRDHESLDLVGAFANHHERRVAVVALDTRFVSELPNE